jgi:hypothetical protein
MERKVLSAYKMVLEEGELRGELKKANLTTRKMNDKSFSSSEIKDITGLSEDQLREYGILLGWGSSIFTNHEKVIHMIIYLNTVLQIFWIFS